jgi:hypothetical protein
MYGTRFVKILLFRFKWPGWCYCVLLPLDDTNLAYRYPTIKEPIRSEFGEHRINNRCATYISHTISHKATQPSIHRRMAQDIRAEMMTSQTQLVHRLRLDQLGTLFRIASRVSFVWKFVRNERCTVFNECLRQIPRNS